MRFDPSITLSVAALVLAFIAPVGCSKPNRDPSPDAAAPLNVVKRWHVEAALRGSYPRLDATEHQLDRRLNTPLRLDFLNVFDEPYTPLDRRADLALTSWYGGFGRRENPRLLWTWYFGGGSCQDLNHQRFVNASLKIDFRYAYWYTGAAVEFYPWTTPSIPSKATWLDRIQAVRPFAIGGIETGYVSAEGEGDYKVSGAVLYHDEQKVRDWLVAFFGGLGVSFPVSDHWSLQLSGDYRLHAYRPEEYNGWNWTTALRYRF